jgi:hypothetical protein
MADTTKNILLRVKSDTDDAEKGFKSLKHELKEIEKELNRMAMAGEDGTEAFQKMSLRAGELKDQIGDTKARINALASDTFKLDAMTGAVEGLASGFAIVEGASALFGAENEDLQKTLVKVQGAMALLQGAQSIQNLLQKESAVYIATTTMAQRVYNAVVGQSTGALKGFKTALLATGIGAIIVAIGTLVAYWDELSGAISGVSKETEKYNETAKADTESAKKKLEYTKDTENVLKLQGKSQRDILNIKIKETDAVIKGIQNQIKGQQLATKQAIEGAKRNKDIVMGILNVLTYPAKVLTKTIDGIVNGLISTANFFGAGIDFKLNLTGGFENLKEMGTELLFDPDKVKADGDKSVEEMNKTLTQMQNEQAGFKLEVKKLDDEDLKKKQEQQKQANENAEKLKNEQIKKDEELKKQLEQNQKDFQDRTSKEYEEAKKLSDDYFDHLINTAKINGEDTTNLELQKLENQLQIQKDYAQNTIAIEDQIALKKKEIGDKLIDEQRKQFEKNKTDYSQTYSEIRTILDDAFAKKLISQKQYNEAVTELDTAQLQGKMQFAKAIGDVLGAMSDLVGKQTKAGKVMATASALINTYLGISEVLKAKNPYPEPFGTAIKIANASVIGINGFKQVREINKVQIPNQPGGGSTGSQPSLAGASGSSPSMGAIGSQLSGATKIQLNQFENMKNPVVRAYVVESEVTGTQQRAKRLKQTSKIN